MNFDRQFDLNVEFLGCSKDPVEIYYSAYQQALSDKPPNQIWKSIKDREIDYRLMHSFVKQRLADHQLTAQGQVYFVFSLNNVSTHFLNRMQQEKVGLESSEKLTLTTRKLGSEQPFLTPPGFKENSTILSQWKRIQNSILTFYKECIEKGIKDEDARLVMPEAAVARKQMSLDFRSMQHFLDQSMCHAAYWEANQIAWQIYNTINLEFPTLSQKLGIKCWENRNLYCDLPLEAYNDCRCSQFRPHKSSLIDLLTQNSDSSIALSK